MNIRSTLLQGLPTWLNGTGIRLTQELPYTQNGVARYLRNTGWFHVGEPRVSDSEYLVTLNPPGCSAWIRTWSITGWVAVDAQNSPDMQAVGEQLSAGIRTLTGYRTQTQTHQTNGVGDRDVHEFIWTFTGIV